MRVTFAGKVDYLNEVKADLVLLDRSFICRGNVCGELEPPRLPNAVLVDTGIKFDPKNEMLNRRKRIAKMLLHALDHVKGDVLFVDSDVIIPDVPFNYSTPRSICIPAKAKPSELIVIFCQSTNMFVPEPYLPSLRDILLSYTDYTVPVDIYINRKLGSVPLWLNGVCHYINGKKYCL